MTKARNLSDLLDGTGDVKSGALDNVPPSNNASALTTGTLPDARLSNQVKVVKSGSAPSNPQEGDLWYDTTNDILKVYDDTASSFVKVVRVTPTLDSISGVIFNATATNLTLNGTGFLTSNLIVSFTPSGGSASTVTVTPTSDTTATVAVPSVIYNQSTGTVIGIKVTNSDSKSSGTTNQTVVALPSGGTITNSGGYRYHKFTSSGTFTNTANLSVDYLAVAGGGSGGATGFGGGGGAGGLLQSTTSLTAQNYSIVIGAGGSPNSNGADTTGLGITAVGGGRGGAYAADGVDGGSGGGGGGDQFRAGGSGTAGQGNNGGLGQDVGPSEGAGGGGGAGAVGENSPTSRAGTGGIGLQYSTFATATSTGDSGYYAGGGGGGVGRNDNANQGAGASGGTGGGGTGGLSNYANSSAPNASPTAGTANIGGGGGGGSATSSTTGSGGASGGSGIFIIRYQL